ncbi:MAG: RNA polymerase sigma factor [Christensenellaceae bacterium]|nr:RNA polymerase sigma factor [Christensenellaceae bacterium]
MTAETFERLYRAYFTQVYRYTLRLCGDEQTAQDVTADTFFRAMTQLDSYREAAAVSTWLCAIARNMWLSKLRRERRMLPKDPLPDATVPDGLQERVEASEARDAIDRLPPPMRDVFLMRVDGGMAFADIGRLLGHTTNWACVTYHRARERLKRELGEEA